MTIETLKSQSVSSLLNGAATQSAPGFGNTARRGAGEKEQRPQAELWLNVGVLSPVTGELISLPSNIPVDTMKQREIYPLGDDASPEARDARNVRIAQNALLQKLLQIGETLGKGERSEVMTLQVQLFRRNDEMSDNLTDAEKAAIAAQLLGDIGL